MTEFNQKALSTKPKATDGFTLIELLVVISIIGVIASIVLTSLNVSRVKARDGQRLSQLRQYQNALFLYNNKNYDLEESVPYVDGEQISCDSGWLSGGINSLVADGTLPTLPLDPTNDASNDYCFGYAVNNNARGACMWVKLESNDEYIGAVVGDPDPSHTSFPAGYNCGGRTISEVVGISAGNAGPTPPIN